MPSPTQTRSTDRPLKSHRSSAHPTSTSTTSTKTKTQTISSAFSTSKRDKRQIKHSSLVSRVSKSSSTVSAEARRNRHRRQKRQLVADLGSLADALPDDGDDGDDAATSTGSGALREHAKVNGNLILQRKSIKSRPGAMKRREKLDKGERERFAMNLVQLTGTKKMDAEGAAGVDSETSGQIQGGQQAPATSARWAALRGFIAQTMQPRSDMKGLIA